MQYLLGLNLVVKSRTSKIRVGRTKSELPVGSVVVLFVTDTGYFWSYSQRLAAEVSIGKFSNNIQGNSGVTLGSHIG